MSAVLRTLLAAFADGDLAAAAACFADDGRYREAHESPVSGRSAIAEHFARYDATGVPWRFDADEVFEHGERACVVYRFAVGGGDGQPWRERAGCATVRFGERGLIEEWREYEG